MHDLSFWMRALLMDSFLINFANFGMSALVAWVCICRLNYTTHRTKIRTRLAFIIIFLCAIGNGFRGPLFGHVLTNWFPVLGALNVFLALLVESKAWKFGAPSYALKKKYLSGDRRGLADRRHSARPATLKESL